MKKAFLDQLFLGFILLTGIVTFVATVNDERATRDKIYDLRSLVTKSSQAMARSYERNIDMCLGKTTNTNILRETTLGLELLDNKANGNIEFSYEYYDLLPVNNDGSFGDNEPDTVITTVTGYEADTFWYRFFDVDSFTLDTISWSERINTPKEVTLRWDTMPNAGYENIMGTYELDNNGCVTNMQMHMANSKDEDKWSKIDPNTGLTIPIVDGITTPPTYIFAIADGNREFNNPSDNAPITLEQDHCLDSTSYPEITINGITKQATVGDNQSANVFFEHTRLNADGFAHYQIIPKTIYQDYIDYKNNIYDANGNEQDKYEAFKNYVDTVINADNDPSNDIDYTNDPHDEYKYALEDLDAADSDFDFTDMLLDGTRILKTNSTDNYNVDPTTGRIIFDNDYCQDFDNNPPELVLTGCPVTTPEDTPTSVIGWTASDSDGTVATKEPSANHGTATININGTITYTPNLNFFGDDTLTVIARDDDDAATVRTCKITVTEVNDPPVISGIPATTASVNNLYDFTPSATDVDGDVLTFSISNQPSWTTFDSSTGQLTGTPTSSDVGTYSNIVITVSDSRGGTDSLPVFSIEVDATSGAPVLIPPGIPDQTVSEGKTYSYNVSQHFTDPDGDTLSYSVRAIYNGVPVGGFTIGTTGTINSITIPNGYAGSVFELTVTASDGTDSVSDTFTLTVTDSTPSFFHTFDTDTQEWNGDASWEKYNNDGKLKIVAKNYNTTQINYNYNSYSRSTGRVYFSFDFGNEFAYKDIEVEFDFYYAGGWESSGGNIDFLRTRFNVDNNTDQWEFFGNGSNGTYGPNHLTYTTKTNSSGIVFMEFFIYVSDVNEFAYVDNVSVKLK